MKHVYKALIEAIHFAYETVIIGFFFPDDMEVLPRETRKILDNPHDRELYRKAIEKLRNGSESEVITLESGEVLTICLTV